MPRKLRTHRDPRTEVDLDALFDEDYLYFNEPILSKEKNDREAKEVARLLDLRPGMTVLDAGCGHGRIANQLAQLGYQVTGLDQSAVFLERARTDAASLGVDIEYVHGDLREIPWRARFDRVLSWWASFGYSGDRVNSQALRAMAQALRPEGQLLLQVYNGTALERSIPSQGLDGLSGKRADDVMIDHLEYDARARRTRTTRTVLRDLRVRRVEFTIRAYTFVELRRALRRAGLAAVANQNLTIGPGSVSPDWFLTVTAARQNHRP